MELHKEEYIKKLEQEIDNLREILQHKENELKAIKYSNEINMYSNYFSKTEIAKYCRQTILPQIGVEGQNAMKNSKVLVIGAGGLGCPAIQYLAGAGIGTIGIVDRDTISISNLHRQILYGEIDIGKPKVEIACSRITKVNSNVKCIPFNIKLTKENAPKIIKDYDIVLDCTDNVPTRYLINDICMLLGKPMVAGNAIKLQGQMAVYIFGKTPCYRCLYPNPPSLECVGSCNEDGVLGAVPGVIGVLQALETIKLICRIHEENKLFGKLTIFEGETGKFRHMSLRSPRDNCVICGVKQTVTLQSLPDYEVWCQMDSQEKPNKYPPPEVISKDQRISVENLVQIIDQSIPHLLIDVRSQSEYEMCRLPNSINFPITQIKNRAEHRKLLNKINEVREQVAMDTDILVCVLCRCGNDSQLAVSILNKHSETFKAQFYDIIGGLYAWHENCDPNFPIY